MHRHPNNNSVTLWTTSPIMHPTHTCSGSPMIAHTQIVAHQRLITQTIYTAHFPTHIAESCFCSNIMTHIFGLLFCASWPLPCFLVYVIAASTALLPVASTMLKDYRPATVRTCWPLPAWLFLVVGKARFHETLKQSNQMCWSFKRVWNFCFSEETVKQIEVVNPTL